MELSGQPLRGHTTCAQQAAPCPRDEPHGACIQDRLRHYLGCVEIQDRPTFFDIDGPPYQVEFDRILRRLSNTNGTSTSNLRTIASSEAAQLMDQWRQRCTEHLRRVQSIREALSLDPEESHLVHAIEASYKMWICSGEYQRGLPVVQGWRRGGKAVSDPVPEKTTQTEGFDETSPTQTYDPDEFIKARVIHFIEGRPVQAELPGVAPHQYCPISELLSKDEFNVASRKYRPDRVKYIHLPSNNMSWVESLIARYYNEEHPNIDRHGEEITHSNTVLRPESWRAQQLGGTNGVTKPFAPRSMRPMCETIPDDADLTHSSRMNNIVLFMPYLHWETGSNHATFAKFIQQTNFAHKVSLEARERQARDFARRSRAALSVIRRPKAVLHAQKPDLMRCRLPSRNVRSVSELVQVFQPIMLPGKLKKDRHGRLLVSSSLAQYLLDASRLYAGIQNYRDKKLIKKYLHADPPMHPRRTLDKAHVLNARTWRAKDQVVYRATSTDPQSFHHYDPARGVWPDHEGLGIYETCPDCIKNISKTPRLIMVDQLWMWVLDKSTVVTAFPMQYGDIKDTDSDIHLAIRDRITHMDGRGIRSAFDVGLLVLEEVFDHLWEPSKALLNEQQPQVLNIFSASISDIKTKQTLALSKFWHWSEIAQENYGRGDVLDLLRIPIQGIGGEGKLLVEIKDSLDELDTMVEISTTQKTIIGDFIELGKAKLYTQKIPGEYVCFCRNADAVRSKMTTRIKVLEELKSTASSVQMAIRDTLGLKQQQDELTQAWRAEVQARENVTQSRSIMVFTVVSVIFLPLTWVTGIFGMNTMEFADGNRVTLSNQFAVMFPLSASVIIIAMVVAYSSQARRLTRTTLSLVMVTLRLYRLHAYIQWGFRWLTNKMEKKTLGQYREILRSEREMHLSRVRDRIEQEEGRILGIPAAATKKSRWFKRRGGFERSMDGASST
ncbi:hypothetical protein MKZ38_002251 [Zalerion maritima]|uniref:Uncharacterized protein n=1 Tax=Zalerion maritima TaxID=339359 RepID=A0AAD5WQX9_9PEZI|nr:hypothetical protein MKZ38_002251 [Zalerion maritima]